MSSFTASRGGQIDGLATPANDTTAIFLKQFGGEVVRRFKKRNKFLALTTVRTIKSGKSAAFPTSWKVTASYHTPGTEIDGVKLPMGERIITINDKLVSPVFIPDIDEAMAHFDVRQLHTEACGDALSETMDDNIARALVLAARTSNSGITGMPGGSSIVAATSRTNADALVGALFDAQIVMDNRNVPEEDRYAALLPDQYSLLVESGSKAIHKDYNPEPNGSFAKGTIYQVAGFKLVKTTAVPQTNVTTGPTEYRGNFTNTAAVCWHPRAVGTVKLMDLRIQSEDSVRHQGTLIVGSYAVGHGTLRPEGAVEIAVS